MPDNIEKTLHKDQIQKIRRRIEDHIRKTNDTRLILSLAKALKLKID